MRQTSLQNKMSGRVLHRFGGKSQILVLWLVFLRLTLRRAKNTFVVFSLRLMSSSIVHLRAHKPRLILLHSMCQNSVLSRKLLSISLVCLIRSWPRCNRPILNASSSITLRHRVHWFRSIWWGQWSFIQFALILSSHGKIESQTGPSWSNSSASSWFARIYWLEVLTCPMLESSFILTKRWGMQTVSIELVEGAVGSRGKELKYGWVEIIAVLLKRWSRKFRMLSSRKMKNVSKLVFRDQLILTEIKHRPKYKEKC